MSQGTLHGGWVNPLEFLEGDERWASILGQPPTLENLLKFLCTPTISPDLKSCIERYKEINREHTRLFIAPAEDRILEKLIWPLRHAKAGYMIGNYLGTISLCGMVSEMLAVLLFEISELRIDERPMSPDDQTALFGSTFEKLSQERRVKVLKAFGIIDKETIDAFELIRTKRRRYLHLWSQDHDSLPADAIAVFHGTVFIAVKVIGQEIHDGKLSLNPSILKYLDRAGLYEPQPDSE